MKMKMFFKSAVLIAAVVLVSCTKDDVTPVVGNASTYVINFGDYNSVKGEITVFDTEKDTTVNNYFKAVNGVSPISNYQYAYYYNGKIFFMGNNVDKVTYVDAKSFIQSSNGISTDIVKPRYCVADGNILYVSCWGGDIWADINTSYIAKIDLTAMQVTKKIALPGGPEGLEMANGKLYAALNYKESVAVINLSDDAISYIPTQSVCSYFIKDNLGNLYVSQLNTFSNPSDVEGIAYINTTADVVEATYSLPGISTGYSNIFAANSDFSKIYTLASSYDENWVQKGSVAVFDVAGKAFETNMLVSGVSGINGVEVDAKTGNILVLVAESVTANGTMTSYQPDGTKIKEYTTGLAPFMMLTLE